MSSSSGSLPSTNATTVTKKTRKSSAYGKEFQQHLTDHRIYGPDHEYDASTPEPDNIHHIQDELTVDRASLSPSQFSSTEFRKFKQKNGTAAFENDVMTAIIPVLCGSAAIPNQQNVLFTELKPITNDEAVKPKPDFFDGASLHDLAPATRNHDWVQLNVIPTKHHSVPVAPNFYLEVKGPDGNAAVAQRQACYDGAYGTRAMHTLQNLCTATPTYDGNAYTYSSTYHDGQLKLYAHHTTAPADGGQPEYHMTQAGAYALTHSRETFRSGVTAFRNARDLAQSHRRSFIQLANAETDRATVADDAAIPTAGCNADDGTRAWLDADDALQQDIANRDGSAVAEDVDEEDGTFEYPQDVDDTEDHSQGSTVVHQDELSMSFTSSFTSANSSKANSKRLRQSHSPPSQSKKSFSSRSTTTEGTSAAEKDESYWVETYMRKGKVCFHNPDNQEIKTDFADWTDQVVDKVVCFYWVSAKSGRSFWTTQLPQDDKRRSSRRHRQS